jgi:hypothetical protein
MNARNDVGNSARCLVEIDRVRLPVTLTALVKITQGMPPGTTMKQQGDWMVFLNAETLRTDRQGGSEQ